MSAEATSADEITVLVVDDDADMRYLARMVLEGDGLAVIGEAVDGAHALEQLDAGQAPMLILLDNQMPGAGGLEIAEQILARRPGQPIVLFSAFLADELVQQAGQLGIAACVSKGDALELADIVRRVLDARSSEPD